MEYVVSNTLILNFKGQFTVDIKHSFVQHCHFEFTVVSFEKKKEIFDQP